MINITEPISEDFDDGINWDKVYQRWEKEIIDYNNGDEEYRQNYWSRYIFNQWWYDQRGTSLPIDIKKLRRDEKDIEKYIPKAMEELREEGYTGEIEYIFNFDEQAKKALEISNETSGNLTKINKTLEGKTKTKTIEGFEDYFEELAKKVGDLYYGNLNLFLKRLAKNINNNEVEKLIEEASENIKKAWEISKSYVVDFLIKSAEKEKKGEEVYYKHTYNIEGFEEYSKEEIAKGLGKLENLSLKTFLKKLSDKIKKDGDADNGRGRKKLANELYACSEKLKQASNKIS